MPLVDPALWTPVGVSSLEPTAEKVVRSDRNALVVAGPGAGKTELLAQRACYLLETGHCLVPRRILAISFKRDAAKNLGDRVKMRCGDRARRFDSYTLDAFAKGLVDRFRLALPEEWQPGAAYEVVAREPVVNDMRCWIDAAGKPAAHTAFKVNELPDGDVRRLFERLSFGYPLPYNGGQVPSLEAYLGTRRWNDLLRPPQGQPSLSFPMLNRLAAFLLRQNPRIVAALRATYAYIFLDEFQDTTASQYDLIRAAFLDSAAILTAVGDSKQRIMLWAGAMREIFDVYQADFNAVREHLVSNYRSVPELVRMQHVIAEALETGTPPARAMRTDSSGSCVIMEFRNPEEEATQLADVIQRGLQVDGKRPRDFCILVRQRTGQMIESLRTEVGSRGIRLRDESQLQDLLTEPVIQFVVAALRLATRPRDAEAWDILTSEIVRLYGLNESDDTPRVEREARRLLERARQGLGNLSELPRDLVTLIGNETFCSLYRQYGDRSFFERIINDLSDTLQSLGSGAATARQVVDDLVGADVVPAMTIHKSKGLEFQTVIFLGLEDSQWWAFANQEEEEKRGFFVAFSRAIQRVIFTFSDLRDGRWGRSQQRRVQIGDLYALLRTAGVVTENHRGS